MKTVDFFPNISSLTWNQEALYITPITEFNFNREKIKINSSLNHKFDDLDFFPSWKEFLDRSKGRNDNYPHYMCYLMCKKIRSNQ